MEFNRIRYQFEAVDNSLTEALACAQFQAGALAPKIVDIIQNASESPDLSPEHRRFLYFGLHALAAARDTSAYRPFVKLLGQSIDRLIELFGDSAHETCRAIVLGLYDGDPAPIYGALTSSSVDGLIKAMLFQALARVTWEGRAPRGEVTDFLARFDDQRLAPEDDAAWWGWRAAIRYLGLTELKERAVRGWLAPRRQVRRWRSALRQAVKYPDDPEQFNDDGVVPMTAPQIGFHFRPTAGPNWRTAEAKLIDRPRDPAKAFKLEDWEVSWLRSYLLYMMGLEMVDGYYAAVAAGPLLENAATVIHFHLYLGPENLLDSGSDIAEGEYAKALLTRHWRTVARRFHRGVNYVPLFDPETADRRGSKWAAGFCEGVHDYRRAWAPLKKDKVIGKWLKDVRRLILPEHDGKQHAISAERRAKILAALPAGIAAAHSFSRRWAETEGRVQGARCNPRLDPPRPWSGEGWTR